MWCVVIKIHLRVALCCNFSRSDFPWRSGAICFVIRHSLRHDDKIITMASRQVERRQIYGATISRLQSGETKQHGPHYFQTSKINTIKIASEPWSASLQRAELVPREYRLTKQQSWLSCGSSRCWWVVVAMVVGSGGGGGNCCHFDVNRNQFCICWIMKTDGSALEGRLAAISIIVAFQRQHRNEQPACSGPSARRSTLDFNGSEQSIHLSGLSWAELRHILRNKCKHWQGIREWTTLILLWRLRYLTLRKFVQMLPWIDCRNL